MSRRVFKYVLSPGLSEIQVGPNPQALTVAFQQDDLCLWAEVDESGGKATIAIAVVPTGGYVPDGGAVYIGTAHTVSEMIGNLVFHVYRLPR